MTNSFALTSPSPDDDESMSEAGIGVWLIDDDEWWAGESIEDVLDEVAVYRATPRALFYTDEIRQIRQCDLDTSFMIWNWDEYDSITEPEKADRISYREAIRRHVANGETFPMLLAAIDL